ncbi:hypothetical protein [Brevundimonas diminuta]|uniref:hypothetical protein n=1 Tax=Brevundimonas diminuta TaxID=293 RepID=UPI0032088ED3
MNLAINAWRFAALNHRPARSGASSDGASSNAASIRTEDRVRTPASVPPRLWFMRAGLVLAAYQARGAMDGYSDGYGA